MSLYCKAPDQNGNRPREFVTTANNLIITKYFFVQDIFSNMQQTFECNGCSTFPINDF